MECFPYDSSLWCAAPPRETDRSWLGKGCIRVAPHRSSSNFVRGHGKSAVIPHFTCCWRSRRRYPNLRPTATATANGGQRVAFTVAAFAPSLGSGPRQGERARRPRRDARTARIRAPTDTPSVSRGAFGGCIRAGEAASPGARGRSPPPRPPPATRVLRCQQEGAARRSYGALRREAPPKPRPPRADREKEAASAAGGAAGAFLYRLDSKTGGEPRSLAHARGGRPRRRSLRVSSFAAYSLTPLHTILRRKKP